MKNNSSNTFIDTFIFRKNKCIIIIIGIIDVVK